MKTKLLRSIDLRQIFGEYQQNPIWGPKRPSRPFLPMSEINFFILFYFSNIKIIYSVQYRPKSFLFGQSAQFGGGLDIYEWG